MNLFSKTTCSIYFILCLSACDNDTTEPNLLSTEPISFKTSGYVISKDSISEPEVVIAGKPDILNFDMNTVVSSGNNVLKAGAPKIVPVGKPYTATPGTAIYDKPIVVKIKDTVVPYVCHEPIPSQRPRFKDDATCNIQYLDVDQGLPNSYIIKIYEDRLGNIWLSSANGLTKYDGKSFANFTLSEGFYCNNRIRAIAEDKNGNIWFGNGKGACKFDGKVFTYYYQENGWPGKDVNGFAEDKLGNMWFSSERGISCFDGKKLTCYSEKQGLVDDGAGFLKIDKKGNLWIATANGLSKWDGKSFCSYTVEQGLISNAIGTIGEDKQGNLWLSSQLGICKFTGTTFEHYTQNEGLLNNDDRTLIVDKEGNVWIACYGGGVNKFDGTNFTQFTEKEGLTINIVWTVMEDRAGNIWIGTDGGGVCKYSARSFSHFTGKQGMGYTIMSVLEDKEKNIWLGSYAAGLWKYDGKSFKLYNDKPRTASTVRSMMQDKIGNIWFGSESGLIKHNGKTFELYELKQGLTSIGISCMLEDKNGNLWFGTNEGLNKFDGKQFTHITKKQGLCSNNVTDILEDKDGNIWVGTTKGLNKYDGKSMLRITENEGLSKNSIKNILEDRNGDIWIGTNGGGLNKYDGKVIKQYFEKNGLSNDFIRSLVEDNPKNLPQGMVGVWASTDNGIDHLLIGNKQFSDTDTSQQEVKIVVYKREDGLKGEDFTSNSGYQDSKSRIWWGSVKSLTMLDASSVVSKNEIPQIKLDNIKLEQKFVDFASLRDSIQNKKAWYVDEKKDINLSRIIFSDIPAYYNYPLNLELPFDINNIEFNYSAIDWTFPYKIRYQYILEGSDKEWHPITSETKAVYTNLGNGDYTFKVKAKGFSDIWSEPFEYHFVIHPPWWKTIWAYFFYFFSFIGVTYLILKWRTKALVERQKELETTIVERTADVVQEKNRVEEKNEIIEKKQKEILDSINYAKQIQYSLLANEELLRKNLPEHFVLFKPKDIVSGDFYWATKKDDSFYLAVCDSTGHGIPGAFMSLLNISFLNEAISEKSIQEPNKVFAHVRERLIQNMEGQDGMDATLVRFEKGNITYSSAYNKPVLIRNGNIIELAADKMPVGKGERVNPFNLYTLDCQKGDMLYFFTDGYADQFGLSSEAWAMVRGPLSNVNGKKFKYKQLHSLLIEIASCSVEEQKNCLEDRIEQWKGSIEQVDDICIIGIRL